jgi:hypothetical protein
MFKKFIFFVIFVFFGFFITTGKVYSQEPPQEVTELSFDQAYAEYINITDEYSKAHAEYVLKRSQQIKFQSLTSRQEAFNATLLMLQKRDEVVVSYLKVLRVKVKDSLGIPDARKESLFFRIDEEINWYSAHRDNLPSTGSLDDLVADSDIAAERWLLMDYLAYEVMSVLSQGKVTDFTKRVEIIYAVTKNKLEEIRDEEREEYTFSFSKTQVLDRWMFEADGKIVRSKEKQAEAEVLIGGIVELKRDIPTHYNLIISKLTEAQIYLKEADLFLKEVVRQIKTEEQ